MKYCPNCGNHITELWFEDTGSVVFDEQVNKWVEDEYKGDRRYSCPLCGYELDYDELVQLGVFE